MSFQAICCIRFVGLVFALSSLAKAWDPSSVRPLLERLSIQHVKLQEILVLMLIFIETCLSVTLLNLMNLELMLPASMVLLLLMGSALVLLHVKGFKESCSCYGSWMKLSPIQALKLDLIYLAMLLWGMLELSEVPSWPIKEEPIIPVIVGLGMMGLGKWRVKF